MNDWLIIYCFMSRLLLKNISLIWRRHHCRWTTAKFRPMLGARGFWAGRDLYRATPTVTQDLGFSGLIRRTVPFSRLLRHAWGRGRPILTQILTGVNQWMNIYEKKESFINLKYNTCITTCTRADIYAVQRFDSLTTLIHHVQVY
jgi:hypothetical protein